MYVHNAYTGRDSERPASDSQKWAVLRVRSSALSPANVFGVNVTLTQRTAFASLDGLRASTLALL